ncbi:MAG: pyridoxal 5'-phosphate synthase glutaminase subunit PdxT [Dehalococcoidia bacterium]
MRVGVLALQGSFAEHCQSFRRLDVSASEVRLPDELAGLHGLVIPGGESTTISHLLQEFRLFSALTRMIAKGFPVWGTCAGMIVLARRSTDMPYPTLGGLDIGIERNGWGRQVDSYEADIDVPSLGTAPFRAIFIRPPVVADVGSEVTSLARIGDAIVAVRQGNVLGTTFHPELTTDLRFHRYFVDIVVAASGATKRDSVATTP